MKKKILTVTILLSSITFFNGCSNKSPQVSKKSSNNATSVYNIMGINTEKSNTQPMFVVKQESRPNYNFTVANPPTYQQQQPYPMAKTYPISNNIEVISYGSPQPPVYKNIQRGTSRNPTALINNLEWNAKSFLGTRYVWGATGPSKFDCSGFTQWVYRDAGVTIPRVSKDQAKVGEYVRYENLQRGDMVFFDTRKRRSGRVTHVGIYLGNGNFIHASSAAKKVVVYNFNQKNFYKKRFLWGRRVIHDNMRYASK
jgi:cell wall-associated NlpC family hydrolase